MFRIYGLLHLFSESDSLLICPLTGCGGLQEQIPYQGLDPQCMSYTIVLFLIVQSLTTLSFSHRSQD